MDTLRHLFLAAFFLLAFSSQSAPAEPARLPPSQEHKRVVENVVFNKADKTISYTLDFPAFIRIRVGIEDGPLYATPVNWKRQKAGRYTVRYQGLDHEKAVFTLHYFTKGDEDSRGLEFYEMLPHPAQLAIGKALPVAWLNQLHKRHARRECYDPPAKISVRGAERKNGLITLKKDSQIVIDLDKRHKKWFRRERFQILIFIDDVLAHAELDGYVPYIWNLKTGILNEGRHTLRVNLSGFSDHLATAYIPVSIEKG